MLTTLSIYVFLSIPSVLIFWEDIRTRFVTIWKFALLAIASLVLFVLLSQDLLFQLKTASFNLLLIAIFYLSLVVVYFLKEKKLNLLLAGKIGVADLLLVLPPALTFSNIVFLYFIVACMLCGLGYGIILIIKSQKSSATVPLAGITAVLYCTTVIVLNELGIDFQTNIGLFDYFIQ